MTPRRLAVHALFPLLLVAVLLRSAPLHAQSPSPFSKTFELSAFGGYTNSNPAYASQYRNSGVALGFDVAHRFDRLPFNTALEARGTFTTGTAIKENTYLGGIHAERRVFRVLHPYAVALAGLGTLNFNFTNPNGYQGDTSIVYTGGGGLDLDFLENFRLKGEYRYEYWTIGAFQNFTPQVLTFGITYHIPFRPHPEDQHTFYH